ncbi:MAG TPA: imidazole glycerol phosphate synthase subunit HisH [Chromatiaceae bacterium]|jgi:glutamine amidotransferase|nr:imidazole glycerol phosphate synthase subunit HisH [Chromatiaceae bacterium]HIA07558.1 imidazole glycerol phosphate synthase subunit HisH [Chromatiaceae bacterium]HIN81930.1 imidazole glycerol phosphate synthase subunit HisH [Chromatiales bacterium]HIO55387.1 imidazole glycerol phosphate synthase subunit HisH [Chromatiales bacterium]
MSSIAVIDYGMGNLHSISKALQHVAGDAQIIVTADRQQILEADRVVFPGVGAIRDTMTELARLQLNEVVIEAARTRPFLGICLGMQALLDSSEENGGIDCLGLIPGQVRYFGDNLKDPQTNSTLKIPHMGWNQVTPSRPHPLWHGIERDHWFYFVHSYFVDPANPDHCAAEADYPSPFAAAIAQDKMVAVQFHPEKSHDSGMTLLGNFTRWNGEV